MTLLPPDYLDTVVALGRRHDGPGGPRFNAQATGFLTNVDLGETDPETGVHLGRAFLVTNHHVVRDPKALWARFNKGDEATHWEIPLVDKNGDPTWRQHANFDIAVIPINAQLLSDSGADFQVIEIPSEVLLMDQMLPSGVHAGDEVFVLGFPNGIAGTARNYVIVRGGVIARIDREILAESNAFLIDSAIYPGNSGGPVVHAAAPTAIAGTPTHNTALVIGVVSGFVPYRDEAVSRQTGRPRVTFEENSGLAWVVPIDAVVEAVKEWYPALPASHKAVQGAEDAPDGSNETSR